MTETDRSIIDVVREKYNKEKHGDIDFVRCSTGDFVYTIKDRKQLDKVFEYYDRFDVKS